MLIWNIHAYTKMKNVQIHVKNLVKWGLWIFFMEGGRGKGMGVAEKYFLICIPLCFEVDRTKYWYFL